MKSIAHDTRLVRMFRVNATQTTVRPQKILPMHQQEGFGLVTLVVVTLVCAVMACVLFYGAWIVTPPL